VLNLLISHVHLQQQLVLVLPPFSPPAQTRPCGRRVLCRIIIIIIIASAFL